MNFESSIKWLQAYGNVAKLSDCEQFELFMGVIHAERCGHPDHAGRKYVYDRMRVPAAMQSYENEVFDRIQTFFFENPDHEWVKNSRKMYALFDEPSFDQASVDERMECARQYIAMLSHFFELPFTPSVEVARSGRDISGSYDFMFEKLAGRIEYNKERDFEEQSLDDFIWLTNHEFGHAVSEYLALRASQHAYSTLSWERRMVVPVLSSDSPLYKSGLLFSFNTQGMQDSAYYYTCDHQDPDISSGYKIQIEEKHANDFARRLYAKMGSTVEVSAALLDPSKFLFFLLGEHEKLARSVEQVANYKRSCARSNALSVRACEQLRKIEGALKKGGPVDFETLGDIVDKTVSFIDEQRAFFEVCTNERLLVQYCDEWRDACVEKNLNTLRILPDILPVAARRYGYVYWPSGESATPVAVPAAGIDMPTPAV